MVNPYPEAQPFRLQVSPIEPFARGEQQPFHEGYLKDSRIEEYVGPLLPRLPNGIPPIKNEKELPAFMWSDPVYSDDFLLRDLINMTGDADGVENHHPEVRQAIFDSLQHHPVLQEHYLHS